MAIKLEDAVAVVQKEIRKWREKYESVANENGQDLSVMTVFFVRQAVIQID